MTIARPPHANPYTSVRFHKGYVKDVIKYRILASDHMSRKERDAVLAEVKTIISGEEAERFVFKVIGENAAGPIHNHSRGWSYRRVDQYTGILAHRGVDVALFHKRQIVEIMPGPGEPVPEGVIKDPVDAWVRAELVGPSARKANLFLKNKQQNLTDVNSLQQRQLDTKQSVIDALETNLQQAKDKILELEERIKKQSEKIRKYVSLQDVPDHVRDYIEHPTGKKRKNLLALLKARSMAKNTAKKIPMRAPRMSLNKIARSEKFGTGKGRKKGQASARTTR